MNKLLLPVLFFLVCSASVAQDLGGKVLTAPDEIKFRNRWGIMPSVMFIKNHPDYTSNSRPGRGLGISYRGELGFQRGERLKLMMGCDYLLQFMSFNSYYNPVLYDKNFKFKHSLAIHQILIPILFKYTFGNEDNSINTFNISGGWSFRALMGANAKVTDNETGEVVWKGFSEMGIEHTFLFDGGGGVMMGGIGMEHKISTDFKKAVYLEMHYRHNLARAIYTGNNFSNEVKFRDPALTICVGYEF